MSQLDCVIYEIPFIESKEINKFLNLLNLIFPNYNYYQSFFSEFCIKRKSQIVYAEVDGVLRGLAIVYVDDEIGKYHMTNFGVHQDYRKKGIGDKILSKIKQKYSPFVLMVDRSDKQTIEFYQKRGLTPEGCFPNCKEIEEFLLLKYSNTSIKND